MGASVTATNNGRTDGTGIDNATRNTLAMTTGVSTSKGNGRVLTTVSVKLVATVPGTKSRVSRRSALTESV